MYTLFSELYTKYCGYPEYNLAILGLQQTGKTQILRALKDDTSTYMVGLKQQYKPTLGLNTKQVNKNKIKFLVWDLGGKPSFRKIWENYFPFTHAVVYLFDNRIVQGFQCLKLIINHQEMLKIPILIFVRNSEFYSEIKEQLEGLKGTQPMNGRNVIIQLLPHTRQRLYQHLEELYENVRKLDIAIRK